MSVREQQRQEEDGGQDPEQPPVVVEECGYDHPPPILAVGDGARDDLTAEERHRRQERCVETEEPDRVAPVAADDQCSHDPEHRERDDVRDCWSMGSSFAATNTKAIAAINRNDARTTHGQRAGRPWTRSAEEDTEHLHGFLAAFHVAWADGLARHAGCRLHGRCGGDDLATRRF